MLVVLSGSVVVGAVVDGFDSVVVGRDDLDFDSPRGRVFSCGEVVIVLVVLVALAVVPVLELVVVVVLTWFVVPLTPTTSSACFEAGGADL